MLKGLAITPPVLGRISIGKVIEKNGKRLPEKDDQFTLTSQVQGRDGWLLHPLNDELRQGKEEKLRSIPVRLLFNEPELNFRADYTLFDRQSGRPVCVGNGETCKRVTQDGMQSLPCPSPDACSLTKGGACKPYGRLNVAIGDEDPLGSFVFRTTGFNSIRTLAARLQYFQAISGNRLACLPLELRLRGKSTRQSHGTPIFYVDLTLRREMSVEEALLAAKQLDDTRQSAGFDQTALDNAARCGLGNGAFEDSEEDGGAVIEEFFPAAGDHPTQPSAAVRPHHLTLSEKLEHQAKQHGQPNHLTETAHSVASAITTTTPEEAS
ncbi:hydrolase or metal-binding protein [Pseudomonas sp. BN411]|uniref:recombination directionality factor n=1 Tax=Pseudomonas sp. BN411 TaxID=2567887 RepID=UPI002457093B|nr:hydrolase or metal-binding protein [Pseudomonas sp. BN411]MDH4562302.1 hydrolase or metal-binding protein [Pseudomonas sp. BN411]